GVLVLSNNATLGTCSSITVSNTGIIDAGPRTDHTLALASGQTLFLKQTGVVSNTTTSITLSSSTIDVSGLTTPPWALQSGQTLSGYGTITGSMSVPAGAVVTPS